jgi:DNA-binding transcriptional MerR regulator
MQTELSIQQVSQQTGLSIDTLRYYERIGLIDPISRAKSGHRRYTEDDLEWIFLLIWLRKTDMPLTQIIHYLQLRRQGPQTLTARRIILEEHQCNLEQRMQQIEQYMIVLHEKIEHLREKEVKFSQQESE